MSVLRILLLMDWIFQDRTRTKLGKTELNAKGKIAFSRKNVSHSVMLDEPATICELNVCTVLGFVVSVGEH